MQHEHTYWDEVRVTQMVDEAADVAVVTGVNAIHLSVLFFCRKPDPEGRRAQR